jgi:hypothetical protein
MVHLGMALDIETFELAASGVVALNTIAEALAEHNVLLRRIALAAEESARNNPLRQLNDILAASAPEETMGR